MNNAENTKYKLIYRIMLAIMVLTVIPIWYLGRYEVLSLDDFYFGAMTHHAWIETHSITEVIKAACEQVRFYFFAKQATYSSVFLMAAFPGVWNINLYFPVPFILSSMIIGSMSALVHTVISDCMGVKDRYLTGIVNMVLIFIVIQTLPVPLEAIFWYNGSLHYAFMESLLFFEAALILHGMRSTKNRTRIITVVAASVIGFIVGGGNLITGLQACILMGLHVLLIICGILSGRKENGILRRTGIDRSDKKAYLFLIPEIITFAGYMVNITAPGNAMRQADAQQMNPVKAIINSFYWGAAHGLSWLKPMTLIGVVIIALVIALLASGSVGRNYLNPVLMGIISFCVFAAMFTPMFYAMSEDIPNRIMNIVYIAEFMLIFINLVNDLGYLYSMSTKEDGPAEFFKVLFELTDNALTGIITVCGIAVVLLFVFCADKNEYVSVSAARSILNGEAARYYEQSMERLEILSGDDSDVTIKAYTADAKPYLLFKQDVGNAPDDEGYWQNIEMSNYFGKNSITVELP